jgi:hypothetical protein
LSHREHQKGIGPWKNVYTETAQNSSAEVELLSGGEEAGD